MSGSPVSGSSYERLLLIGRGGMGEVFLARQRGVEGFQRPVALKRILPGHGNDPDHRRMFLSEARIMASLNHPNICQTVDFCSADSDLFLVLELLDGVNLATLVKEVGNIPTPVVGGILLQALAGLAHAHSKGLIHRDLSPSNLFLTSDGVLKILDFGVAKVMGSELSSSGLKGKSPYMSPEQVAGREVDERSDLFALGAVGLEALSGTALFLRDSEYLTYQAILEGTRPVGLTTSPLDPVLARCLDTEPSARPQSARQLAQTIRSALASHGGEASPHDLAGYLEEHMADVLERFRALKAEALMSGASERGPILHTVEMQAVQPLALASTMASPGFSVSPPTDRVVRRPASRWRGLAALLGLVAIGLGSALWLNMRASGETTAAVVPADAAPVARLPIDAGHDAAPPAADAAPPAADAAPTASPTPTRPRKPPGQGHVSLDSSPFATIEIDGKEVGTTPLLRHSLPEGIHRVVATTADGRQQRFKIRVRAGKLTARRLTFD